MKAREIVAAQLNHTETPVVPYSLFVEAPLARRLDAASGTAWRNKVQPHVIITGCFDTWDTLRPFGEGTQIDVYGSVWRITEDIAHLETPALSRIDPSAYKFPALADFGYADKLDAMRETLSEHPDLYPVGSLGAGIYELLWRMYGVEETLIAMYSEPSFVLSCFDKLMELILGFADVICALPVEAVLIGDDWADQRGVTFGRPRWKEMIRPYYETLYAHIHKKGKKTITHCCGSPRDVIPDLIGIGLDVLETVQPEAAGMDPYALKAEFGRDLSFWGALGCQRTVCFDRPEEVRAEIRKLRSEMSRGGGYILAPCKPLNTSVPVDNALAIIDEFSESNL